MIMEKPETEGMNGPHIHLPEPGTYLLSPQESQPFINAAFHTLGRFFSKGKGNNMTGFHTVNEQ